MAQPPPPPPSPREVGGGGANYGQSIQYSKKALSSRNFIKVIFYVIKSLFTFDMPYLEFVHI